MMQRKIVLASSNRGKLAEFNTLLADSGFEVVTQGSLGIEDAEETGLSFVENALLKARHASKASGLPALADDSGLCVQALDGAPGLYSARYAGVHGENAANNAKLLGALEGISAEHRAAFFICALALVQRADDPTPIIVEGRWYGHVLELPSGAQGFGYDPLFLPDGQQVSAAELDPAIKNRLSHRGQALTQLKARLATVEG